VLSGFSPHLLLVLNLVGTFAFGISGGLAAVRNGLDVFGAVVLAEVVGLAGGIMRDVLIGVRPATLGDWRYLAAAGSAGLLASLTHPVMNRIQRPIDTLDAAGLSVFCVTGAATALAHGLGTVEAIILGTMTGIGGGMVRDVLVREIPIVLRGSLYAIPALLGAGVVVLAYRQGNYSTVFPIIGAAACFAIRMAGLRYDLSLPAAKDVPESVDPRRLRKRERRSK
jgi:uncharacterized membrane protein YeiH